MVVARQDYLNQLISYKDKDIVKVVTGVRRCGKSVLLNEIYYGYLLQSGVKKENIIKVNLESIKCADLLKGKNLYNFIVDKIGDSDEKYYVFIDEVQLLENFEDTVNGLRVDANTDIYLTGSNSKLLSKDINTKMRGRSVEIRVFPLSFKEFYSFYGGDKRECFNNFWKYGGLPYLLSDDVERNKRDYLDMICNTVVTRDIIERHEIRNEQAFNSVVNFLCSAIGTYVNPKKISDTLQSNGVKVSVDTIQNYLEYVTDAFLFYKAERFDVKGKQYLKTQNKYYITDLGIRNSKLGFRQMEITHALENIVYLELVRRGYKVDVGKNNAKEIDFVATLDGETYYLQVAYTLTGEGKTEQEISSFYGIDDGYKKIVITMDDDPFTKLEKGYKKLNIYDFLLDFDSLERV